MLFLLEISMYFSNALLEITEVANKVYNSGQMTEQLWKSSSIPVPRGVGTLDWEKHGATSIMSQRTNFILKVILKRFEKK